MNGQNRVGRALLRALVDHLLRAPLDLRVTTLHRVKVKLCGIGAGSHRTGRAAAHANPHAGSAELNQQRARREENFFCQCGINGADAARNHDGLVIPPALALGGLLIFTKVTVQVGPAKFVVECCAAEWAFGHDLQRAGDVVWLAVGRIKKPGNSKSGQTCLGFGAAPGCAFVANLTACTSGCTRERRDGCRVVVGFDLHQDVGQHIV